MMHTHNLFDTDLLTDALYAAVATFRAQLPATEVITCPAGWTRAESQDGVGRTWPASIVKWCRAGTDEFVGWYLAPRHKCASEGTVEWALHLDHEGTVTAVPSLRYNTCNTFAPQLPRKRLGTVPMPTRLLPLSVLDSVRASADSPACAFVRWGTPAEARASQEALLVVLQRSLKERA